MTREFTVREVENGWVVLDLTVHDGGDYRKATTYIAPSLEKALDWCRELARKHRGEME